MMIVNSKFAQFLASWLLVMPISCSATADDFDDFEKNFDLMTDDRPVPNQVIQPPWFKASFLDLADDLEEARVEKKAGIAVYFGQKDCSYCRTLMEVNLKTPDIVRYIQKNFDVIPLDIWGSQQVTDLQGVSMTEREFAVREKTNFTPSLIFYDLDGKVALRLRGYYPPYAFRAALKYVVEGFYKEETLQAYMDRANPPAKFEQEELNSQPFFEPPPYALDRSRFPADKPLIVFFEQKSCHACDILHTEPLGNSSTIDRFSNFETVQLDVEADTPVVTPSGEQLTARQWSEKLGIFYTPALLFFDQSGKEIIRLDSVTGQHRLRGVMNYVLSGAYKKYPTYLEYRFGRIDAY
ncbi:MAG: thioredoxin fold domain-containing protein [Arenicellales bacterium]|jgi:thioredoxin-related protein